MTIHSFEILWGKSNTEEALITYHLVFLTSVDLGPILWWPNPKFFKLSVLLDKPVPPPDRQQPGQGGTAVPEAAVAVRMAQTSPTPVCSPHFTDKIFM